jgi:hypothetical protein
MQFSHVIRVDTVIFLVLLALIASLLLSSALHSLHHLPTVSSLAERRTITIAMSSAPATSKPPPPVRTDAAQISGWNRGAITTPFVMAPSCTDVLTLSTTKDELRLVFAHAGQEYLDPACIPIGTKAPSELVWTTYYCMSPLELQFLSFPLSCSDPYTPHPQQGN